MPKQLTDEHRQASVETYANFAVNQGGGEGGGWGGSSSPAMDCHRWWDM